MATRRERTECPLEKLQVEGRTRTPTPTPHRVSAMPNTMAGAPNDSDSEGGEETGGARRLSRVQSETPQEGYPANTLSSSGKNQQMGAPPGTGVLPGGSSHAASTPRRQLLSPLSVGQPRPSPPDLYPSFSLLQQSQSAPAHRRDRRGRSGCCLPRRRLPGMLVVRRARRTPRFYAWLGHETRRESACLYRRWRPVGRHTGNVPGASSTNLTGGKVEKRSRDVGRI